MAIIINYIFMIWTTKPSNKIKVATSIAKLRGREDKDSS